MENSSNDTSSFCELQQKLPTEERAVPDVTIEVANSHSPDLTDSSFIKYVSNDCVIEYSTNKLSKTFLNKNQPSKSTEIELVTKESSDMADNQPNQILNPQQTEQKDKQQLKAERKALFVSIGFHISRWLQ